jgi:drug/metabolite transporter (DMT)-like permease
VGRSTRVNAVANSSSFIVVLVMAVLYGKTPNSLEMLAIIAGASGVIVISLNESEDIN